MKILELDDSIYYISIELPDCECINWSFISNKYFTSHKPNCSKVKDEIMKNGFIKVCPPGSKFICRVSSTNNLALIKLFYGNLDLDYNVLLPDDLYIQSNTLEELAKNIIYYNKNNKIKISSRPLLIDNLLYVRYYNEDGEFLFHEEYSYIKDEHETTKS